MSAPIGYCVCGRPAATSAGSCGRWECWKNGSMISADAVPPGANPSGELSPDGEIFAGQQPGGSGGFQARVEPWMCATFGDVIPFDKTERGDRLLEEVFELLQSGGYEQSRVRELCNYTWGRPPGEPAQEVGGVMVTLAAYCLAFGLDMHEAGETELARIWTKVEAIRAKQAAKPRGIALPIDPNGGAS